MQDALFYNLRLNNDDNCLLGVIYRPPCNSTAQDDLLSEALLSVLDHKFSHVFILGDFNFPNLSTSVSSNPLHSTLRFLLETGHLYNRVTLPTRFRGTTNPSILDLVLTNEELMVETINYGPPLGSSDHVCLDFDFICYAESSHSPPTFRSKTNYNRAAQIAQKTTWVFLCTRWLSG